MALLHDVVEDHGWGTIDELAPEGLPATVTKAVIAISRRKGDGETYAAYTNRLAKNPLAVTVKLADLRDHLRPERIGALPPEQAASLFKRYLAAWRTLTNGGEQ